MLCSPLEIGSSVLLCALHDRVFLVIELSAVYRHPLLCYVVMYDMIYAVLEQIIDVVLCKVGEKGGLECTMVRHSRIPTPHFKSKLPSQGFQNFF